MDSKKLEAIIGYEFKNKDLLKESITHRSYLNENPSWNVPHNERLEFLGDAVLELVVTEELFNRYPGKPEGQLTPLRSVLVNYQSLARTAKAIGLFDYILLSKGEAKDSGKAKDAILANAVEALIGAIYLDGGYKKAKEFINKFIVSHLKNVLKNGNYRDAKSLLQEKVQAQSKITPLYKVLEESGPEHDKLFKVGVYINNRLLATGEGRSKQEAELKAAQRALKHLS